MRSAQKRQRTEESAVFHQQNSLPQPSSSSSFDDHNTVNYHNQFSGDDNEVGDTLLNEEKMGEQYTRNSSSEDEDADDDDNSTESAAAGASPLQFHIQIPNIPPHMVQVVQQQQENHINNNVSVNSNISLINRLSQQIGELENRLNMLSAALNKPTVSPTAGKQIMSQQKCVKRALSQHIAVHNYLVKRTQGLKKMEASQLVAYEMYEKGIKHSFKAKCIRLWADEFAENLCLKERQQGKHSKVKSIILDPAIRDLMRAQVVEQLCETDRTPARFYKLLNESLLAEIPGAPERVSKETCRRWFQALGFVPVNGTQRNITPSNL